MTRDETVALFLECEAKRAEARAAARAAGKSEREVEETAHESAKAHWNAWAGALLAERKAMESEGRWTSEKSVWKDLAKANFSFCLFRNKDAAKKEKSAEALAALIKKAKGARTTVAPIDFEAETTNFEGFIFPGEVSFDSATIMGRANCASAAFKDHVFFDNTTFSDEVLFRQAKFEGAASFNSTIFAGPGEFERAEFIGNTSFDGATFHRPAWFRRAIFSAAAQFLGAKFKNAAMFHNAAFLDKTMGAWFDDASFADRTCFDGVIFSSGALFGDAKFLGGQDVSFERKVFAGKAGFEDTTFNGFACFRSAIFYQEAFFNGARFAGGVCFNFATFEHVVQFRNVAFLRNTEFNAILGKRAFTLAGARFENAPDFIQAHFEEAPRLDDMKVAQSEDVDLLTEPEARDLFARWRALKRLAIQAHDTDRELKFNAQEIRAERAASRWPIPVNLRKGDDWLEAIRSFSGWLYGLFSDYGRSLLRPLGAWAAAIAFFGAFYLSQTEVMQRELALKDAWWGSAAAHAGHYAVANPVPCYAPPPKEKP